MNTDMDYDSLLGYASSQLFDASMAVATKLPGLSGLSNEVLWTLQGEVLWTFTGSLIRDLTAQYNPSAHEAIEEEVLPQVIGVMLARIFNWQENTDTEQMSQHESFLYWYDEAEIGAAQSTGFAMSDEAIQAMASGGEIPTDTYVGRLCRRVAKAAEQPGSSELIQGLARDTAGVYNSMQFAELATSLAMARRALVETVAAEETADSEAPGPDDTQASS